MENAFSAGAYGISPWGSVQPPVPPGKVYDFGITTSGWARITLQATAGTEVDIRYSEQLNSDGTVASEGANAQTDTYIAKGGGPETDEPKYGWKGYRYIQVWTPSVRRSADRLYRRHRGAHRPGRRRELHQFEQPVEHDARGDGQHDPEQSVLLRQ